MNKSSRITKVLILVMMILSLLLSFSFEINAKTNNKIVVLGGDSIGLDINSSVYITGKAIVSKNGYDYKPWEYSDIQIGDMILEIDDRKIPNKESIKDVVKEEKSYSMKLIRNDKLVITNILAIKNDKGEYQLGLYVKDNVLGVGTLTYYDLKTKKFASLGHKALDGKIQKGVITKSYVSSIKKGERGLPGEKKAILDKTPIGDIVYNNDIGVFGSLYSVNKENDLIEIGNIDNVHVGKAQIVTVIKGNTKENFDIEIIDVQKQDSENVKGIKFSVVDDKLIKETGGIIQGMSGSPIIQDDKLVGAVSHVLLEDSKVGFGVFAEFMSLYA